MYRGGLVLKAHIVLYPSTLGLKVIKKKRNCGQFRGLLFSDTSHKSLYAQCTPAKNPTPSTTIVRTSGYSQDAMPGPKYRGTSLIRNSTLLRPYSRTMQRALW